MEKQVFQLNVESMCNTCSKQHKCPLIVTQDDTKIVRQCASHDPMKESVDYLYAEC